jgi:hypothetical protein
MKAVEYARSDLAKVKFSEMRNQPSGLHTVAIIPDGNINFTSVYIHISVGRGLALD